MSGNALRQETSLLEAAANWLNVRLPEKWSVERAQDRDGTPADGLLVIRAPHGTYTQVAVEAKDSIEPRAVAGMLSGLVRSLRQVSGNVPLLVVAPWISERTRETLVAAGLNYLDLTGNALLRLDNPALYISSTGAAKNPTPRSRSGAGLRGARAARLLRLLADVRPPYGVSDLAGATELTPGYISRLLDTLDREAIVERGARGVVEGVDVAALLRAWAEAYDVFKSGAATAWIAPGGASAAFRELTGVDSRIAVTGSFSAVRWAPVAAPAQLVAYAEDLPDAAARLRLLPADQGANVILLRPFDKVVWQRTVEDAGISYAAPSQVVVDCLTGTGRMPAEGDALLAAMVEDEAWWRNSGLPRNGP